MFHEGILLFLAVVAGWLAFLWVLRRLGWIGSPEDGEEAAPAAAPEVRPGVRVPAKRRAFALTGPFLMWKTLKGRALIDRIAQRRRLWRWFGDVSIVLVGIAMVSMTIMLVWLATLVVNIPSERAPTPDLLLGIPGVNRLIPLTYGILGLAVAIIVHEFCHGILARASKVKVKALGLLFFIVPIGAFVEPDEDEMKAMPRRERARLYAAGPAVNLVFAAATAFVFSVIFMASVAPIASGVGVAEVVPDAPAQAAGIRPGMIITSVDGTAIANLSSFFTVMADTSANQTVNVTYMAKGWTAPQTTPIVLADAADFTKNESRRGKGFLGITIFPQRISTAYFHPIGGADELGGLPQSVLTYISLPFFGLQPIQGITEQFFQVQGPLAAIPEGAFWVLANSFYWLFWLNLMLGLTNALPAVPLDGGYIFRDGLHALFGRVRSGMGAEARERAVKRVSYVFALLILALIVWQLVGPRIL